AIAGSTTCGVRRTRSISQPTFRWRRESSSAQARGAARRSVTQASSLFGHASFKLARRSRRQRCLRYETGSRPGLWHPPVQQFLNFLRAIQAHDALTQFFALLFPDHITTERGEFHRDFFLCHWIARVAFWHIDAS